jgi:hypothetical protein
MAKTKTKTKENWVWCATFTTDGHDNNFFFKTKRQAITRSGAFALGKNETLKIEKIYMEAKR